MHEMWNHTHTCTLGFTSLLLFICTLTAFYNQGSVYSQTSWQKQPKTSTWPDRINHSSPLQWIRLYLASVGHPCWTPEQNPLQQSSVMGTLFCLLLYDVTVGSLEVPQHARWFSDHKRKFSQLCRQVNWNISSEETTSLISSLMQCSF